LKKVIKEKGGDDFLKMREEDLLLSRPDYMELSQFPDRMVMGSNSLNCSYRFAPGEKDDGVTVTIPSSLVSRIPAENLEWGIPGLLREKVTSMIKGLPKRYRKQLVPVSRTVDVVMEEMEQNGQSLLTALARFIYRRFGVDIPASVWSDVQIPEYLKMRISVTDQKGEELDSGRDIHLLRNMDSPLSEGEKSEAWRNVQSKWEKTAITTWDFDSLPESIPLEPHLFAYPGLEDRDGRVNIRLFQTSEQALESHKRGVQTLFSLHMRKDLKFLKKDLILPEKGSEGAKYFGGVRAVESALYECFINNLFYITVALIIYVVAMPTLHMFTYKWPLRLCNCPHRLW